MINYWVIGCRQLLHALGLGFEMQSVGAVNSDMKLQSIALDVFKGLAAIAMVINHSGYALLSAHDAQSGWLGYLIFAGSFAPALFFFGTGYAAGLSPKQKCVDWRSVLKKVGWLILADQTLLWSGGIRLGMDFFGFIAVSVLVMAFLQGLRHSQIICIGAILFLLSVRYAARDLVESVINQEGVLVWATGVRGQDGWSYPLSPWLVAPLAGFLCARRSSEPKLKHRILITPIALMVGIALTTILHYRGFIFFRWGSVSVAYFVLATPIILVTFLFAEWITGRYSRIAARLSLRGASAFLVVPVHYGALALLKDTGMTVWTSSNWLLGLASMLLLSGVAVLSSQQLATKLSLYQLHLRSGAATLLMGVLLFTAWTSTAHTLIGGLSCAAVQCIIAVRLTR